MVAALLDPVVQSHLQQSLLVLLVAAEQSHYQLALAVLETVVLFSLVLVCLLTVHRDLSRFQVEPLRQELVAPLLYQQAQAQLQQVVASLLNQVKVWLQVGKSACLVLKMVENLGLLQSNLGSLQAHLVL